MPVTIKEIAKKLGLNPSTVSRALSGSPEVSICTKEKVVKTAKELHYIPNLWAQNLVGTTSSIVGCLVLELTNPFYIPMVRAIEDAADKEDYIVILGESRKRIEVERHVVDRFRRMRIAGVIITPILTDLDHLFLLQREGVPVIVAGRNVKDFDSINIDNIKSGNLAGEHLVRSGHERIGFVQSGDPYNYPEKDRLQGLQMSLAGQEMEVSKIYTGGNNRINGGEIAAEMWLQDRKRPTGVFCTNDMVAMGFIQRVMKAGIKVPEQVSVVGHDDIPFADSFVVPLTTIAFPKYELGHRAMEALVRRLQQYEAKPSTMNVSLEPELLVRRSSKYQGPR
jgi:LacI family transcriptional regulator